MKLNSIFNYYILVALELYDEADRVGDIVESRIQRSDIGGEKERSVDAR